jgi:hypothetical protein
MYFCRGCACGARLRLFCLFAAFGPRANGGAASEPARPSVRLEQPQQAVSWQAASFSMFTSAPVSQVPSRAPSRASSPLRRGLLSAPASLCASRLPSPTRGPARRSREFDVQNALPSWEEPPLLQRAAELTPKQPTAPAPAPTSCRRPHRDSRLATRLTSRAKIHGAQAPPSAWIREQVSLDAGAESPVATPQCREPLSKREPNQPIVSGELAATKDASIGVAAPPPPQSKQVHHLSAVEEWEARVAAPRRAAAAAISAQKAKVESERQAAAVRAAEIAALTQHANQYWRQVGHSHAVQTLSALHRFLALERLHLNDAALTIGTTIDRSTSTRIPLPLLTRRRVAIEAFLAERRRSIV